MLVCLSVCIAMVPYLTTMPVSLGHGTEDNATDTRERMICHGRSRVVIRGWRNGGKISAVYTVATDLNPASCPTGQSAPWTISLQDQNVADGVSPGISYSMKDNVRTDLPLGGLA